MAYTLPQINAYTVAELKIGHKQGHTTVGKSMTHTL